MSKRIGKDESLPSKVIQRQVNLFDLMADRWSLAEYSVNRDDMDTQLLKFNITRVRDRGKDVECVSWFKVFQGERINDHRLKLAEKMAANGSKT